MLVDALAKINYLFNDHQHNSHLFLIKSRQKILLVSCDMTPLFFVIVLMFQQLFWCIYQHVLKHYFRGALRRNILNKIY